MVRRDSSLLTCYARLLKCTISGIIMIDLPFSVSSGDIFLYTARFIDYYDLLYGKKLR